MLTPTLSKLPSPPMLPQSAQDMTGDKSDVKRVCRQVMNKAATKRLISKQEACVLLSGLDLTHCSETIESVSISNSKQLRKGGEETTNKTFIDAYARRPKPCLLMSLHQYFHYVQGNRTKRKGAKQIVPNFVGVNGTPKYPVTDDYARHVLVVYRPWLKYPRGLDWQAEFHSFINSKLCPQAAKITYQRVMQRYITKTVFCEPTAADGDHTGNPMSEEDRQTITLFGLHHTGEEGDHDATILHQLDRGLTHEWDKQPKVRLIGMDQISDPPLLPATKECASLLQQRMLDVHTGAHQVAPELWLENIIIEHQNRRDENLDIPLTEDGKQYTMDMLKDDQKDIVAVVLHKLREWLTCSDLSKFEPLRITINGSAGSGKSTVINTLVSLMRKMFKCNGVVKVAAPTGTAAFNVRGETFHHMLGMGVNAGEYTPYSMARDKKKMLMQKFARMLALIIDERSLVNSKDLGTAEQMFKETLYGGHLPEASWGGLPIVIIVGDDYQLPATTEGALDALFKQGGGTMTRLGRMAFLELARDVMELKKSKRIKKGRANDRALLDRLRDPDKIVDRDIQKLLSLRLDDMERRHGPEVVRKQIEGAMYLYYTNEKRIRHNLIELSRASSAANPVAVMKCKTCGLTTDKGDRRHFDNDKPATAMLCLGSRVALENKNFCPQWGLHNGACGTVDEIVYAEGTNPNHGDHPLYMVVHFPLYCGPPWDTDNPKVRPDRRRGGLDSNQFKIDPHYFCSWCLYLLRIIIANADRTVVKDPLYPSHWHTPEPFISSRDYRPDQWTKAEPPMASGSWFATQMRTKWKGALWDCCTRRCQGPPHWEMWMAWGLQSTSLARPSRSPEYVSWGSGHPKRKRSSTYRRITRGSERENGGCDTSRTEPVRRPMALKRRLNSPGGPPEPAYPSPSWIHGSETM